MVSHAPSRNYCRHQGAIAPWGSSRTRRRPTPCAKARRSRSAIRPAAGACSSTSSACSRSTCARCWRSSGSVQELSAQLHSKDAQIAVLAKQNQELGHRVAALEMVAAQQ